MEDGGKKEWVEERGESEKKSVATLDSQQLARPHWPNVL